MEAFHQTKETTTVDLDALLDAGDDAVVTLVAGETRLVAHRAVLMDRSPVFSAMFAHDMLEASSGQVDIADVEGPVLRQLLSYLYTLRAPQLPGMAAQLLAAADKYGVPGLKAACEQQVAAQLSVETAAAAAVLAVRHSCDSLRKDAINFIKHHNYQVMATQGWADAVINQSKDVVEVSRLLADPPAESRSLSAEEKVSKLVEAAKLGLVGELDALLAAGADVAAVDVLNGCTALHKAAWAGNVEAVRLLLARGAPVDVRDIRQGRPLHWAAMKGHAAVVRLLLARCAHHSARDEYGQTPLHHAAANDHTEAAAALLEAGADRGARDNSGQTPLDVARRRNKYDVLDLLTRM